MKLAFAICVIISATFLSLAAQEPAELILINGKVFTSDLANPYADAVAIRGDRILALGTSAEVRKLAAPATRIIDLGGRTVVPGFNDAHAHFGPTFQGFDLQFKSQEPTWGEASAAIALAVAAAPKGQWIFGAVGESVINDARAARSALDLIAPDHPVFLSTFFGHGAIVNSRGLAALKISEGVSDPMGGRFERDAKTNKLTGRVFEYAVWNLGRILTDEGTDAQLTGTLQSLAAEAASHGITSMQIMPSISIERFVRILNNARLPIRVRAMAFSTTTKSGRDLRDVRSLATSKPAAPNVSASGIKWIIDGTPLERGAAMSTPYLDKPDTKGRLNFSVAEIEKFVRQSIDLEQPLLVHAVGDLAVETLIDAMEKIGAERKIDWPSRRVRIEHAEGLTEKLIPRAKKLGIVVVQNPSHFTVVNEMNARLGKDTKLGLQRSLIDGGIMYALGSDGPINPFLNIMFAVIDPTRPDQAITREQAVRSYTYGSAYAEFAEAKKGMLRPGMLADLAVLSQDIFNVPTNALPGTTSVMTIVGGRIVHDTTAFK